MNEKASTVPYFAFKAETSSANNRVDIMSTNSSLSDNTDLAYAFFRRVWTPPHDLDAIDELMTEDYRRTTAGNVIHGRGAFKAWVADMQRTITDATNEHLEIFTNTTGDRIVSRWITRGSNNGIFGLPADNVAISFTGIPIWRVEIGRLAECWVERSAAVKLCHRRDREALSLNADHTCVSKNRTVRNFRGFFTVPAERRGTRAY